MRKIILKLAVEKPLTGNKVYNMYLNPYGSSIKKFPV
jgi:hypothetical protein